MPGANHPPVVAFGPSLPQCGSWEWVGADIACALAGAFNVVTFRDSIPECDVAVIVKYDVPWRSILEARSRCALVYCPIDRYGSAADIDADYELLRSFARVVVHCPELAKYFGSYVPVECVEHHVKFTAPPREAFSDAGDFLWTGVRSNLPPLAAWINKHRLPGRLLVLTDVEGEGPHDPQLLWFRADRDVRVERWTADRHRRSLATARAAIDVKGDDFRQRHKPAAKALDCIASGVPLACNAGGSTAARLRRMGFDAATPENQQRWLSRDYWEATQGFGRAVRAELSLERVAARFQAIIEDVLRERGRG